MTYVTLQRKASFGIILKIFGTTFCKIVYWIMRFHLENSSRFTKSHSSRILSYPHLFFEKICKVHSGFVMIYIFLNNSMNRILTVSTIAIFAVIMGLGVVSPAIAAKPQPVIEISNGFPSGEHHNLNIHGKKDGFSGCDDVGGSSIFMAEYGKGTIEFVSNQKASLDSLTALDKCAEQFDGDPARVQVPYENEGYY